jgi:hypothetical protein
MFTPCSSFKRFAYSAPDIFPRPTKPTVLGFFRIITSAAFSASQASSHHTFGRAGVLIRSFTPLKAHLAGLLGGDGAAEPCAIIVMSSSRGKTALIGKFAPGISVNQRK